MQLIQPISDTVQFQLIFRSDSSVLACLDTDSPVLACLDTESLVLACLDTDSSVLACLDTDSSVLAKPDTSYNSYRWFSSSVYQDTYSLELIQFGSIVYPDTEKNDLSVLLSFSCCLSLFLFSFYSLLTMFMFLRGFRDNQFKLR